MQSVILLPPHAKSTPYVHTTEIAEFLCFSGGLLQIVAMQENQETCSM